MKYYRNDRQALFDKYRGILVPDKPEERVRQKIAKFLETEKLVPKEAISIEYPLMKTVKETKLRADIVVWATRNNEKYPLLAVEIKAEYVTLTDEVLEQVIKYKNKLGCAYYGVTNGNEYRWFVHDSVKKELVQLPKYGDLVKHTKLKCIREEEPLERSPLEVVQSPEYIGVLKKEGYIGEDTPNNLWPVISDLFEFILSGEIPEKLPIISDKIKLIDDLKISYRKYGNAAGGTWPGIYRRFIVEDGKSEHQIYSIGIMGKDKLTNDPQLGNTQGNTVLIVAIDDYDKRHNSLQMNIDASFEIIGNACKITHDGKITVGNKGAASPQSLFEFMRGRGVDSIFDNRIHLGSIPSNNSITWQNSREFFMRVLNYAYYRDEFRKTWESSKRR
jgi:hypothetical protein